MFSKASTPPSVSSELGQSEEYGWDIFRATKGILRRHGATTSSTRAATSCATFSNAQKNEKLASCKLSSPPGMPILDW